jgi:hypothetical protein
MKDMTFGDASAFSSFDPTPRAPSAPKTQGPYAFDDVAKTVDLALIGTWDEGYTAADVLFGMMKGDAALPNGPYADILVQEPFADEGFEQGQSKDGLPRYLVKGFDALCTFSYPITLCDENGVFATIPMENRSFAEIRRLVNQAVSTRLGGAGKWRSERAVIGSDGRNVRMNVPIVRV